MRSLPRGLATIGVALMLAACSGGGPGATTGPTGGAGTAAAAPCAESADPTKVNATVEGFTWAPVTAKVGDVITWTNKDAAPHSVALDDGSCAMAGNISGGGTRSLVFSVAGTFPFHCSVHSSMKGTITIS
jgi:plastocyanin